MKRKWDNSKTDKEKIIINIFRIDFKHMKIYYDKVDLF